tara:strand:+ start:1335 stop:1967 length:633 start_codon:yes stop_codon:yes gene_type:complete
MSSKYKYLVFDTETTGLPPRKNDRFYSMFESESYPDYADLHSSNHCRMVSISWMVYEIGNKQPLIDRYYVVKPEGFIIPESSTKIHGITTEFALNKGEDILNIFKQFEKDLKDVNVRIAHNFLFDKYVVGSEMYRNLKDDLLDRWDRIPSFCTMVNAMTKYDFGLTKFGNAKPPKLDELYYKLHNKHIENAHNAYNDTKACAECYQVMSN